MGDADGLGWYASTLVQVAGAVPDDPEGRRRVVRRVLLLTAAGWLAPIDAARALRALPGADPARVARFLARLADTGLPARQVWTALAWFGEAGRSELGRIARTGQAAAGAASALYAVEPGQAVAAVRDRLFRHGLPVDAADAVVLTHLPDDDVRVLAAGLRRQPDNARLAQNLGWTRHSLARDR
jgi:hypothetical protein